MELPLWLHDPQYASMLSTPVGPALDAGLVVRPLIETVAATLEWIASGEAPADPPAGLSRAKEDAVLAAWAKQSPERPSAEG
jgi:hypothetical protein